MYILPETRNGIYLRATGQVVRFKQSFLEIRRKYSRLKL